MNWPAFVIGHRSATVDDLAQNVEYSPQRGFPDRHRQWLAGIDHVHAASHAVSIPQSHTADPATAEMMTVWNTCRRMRLRLINMSTQFLPIARSIVVSAPHISRTNADNFERR